MSHKRSAPSDSSYSEPKRQKNMLTTAEKVRLLDMLKEGKSYAYVGRHYGINESLVRDIKKNEKNIMATAKMTFKKTAKRVVTVVPPQKLDRKIKEAAELAEEMVFLKGCLSDYAHAVKNPLYLVGRTSTFYPRELGEYVEEFCRELDVEGVQYHLIAGDSSWGKPTLSVRGYGLVVMFGHGDLVDDHKRDQAQRYADESGQKCTFIFFASESRVPIIDTFHP